jgi:hypothetical protein
VGGDWRAGFEYAWQAPDLEADEGPGLTWRQLTARHWSGTCATKIRGKGRVGGQVVSRAVVVATGVSMNGDREVLGCAVGDSEDEAFWTTFLRSLRERGVTGVRRVISHHHLGLKKAIATVMLGSACQRCRVHFMRNIPARVPRANTPGMARRFPGLGPHHCRRQVE